MKKTLKTGLAVAMMSVALSGCASSMLSGGNPDAVYAAPEKPLVYAPGAGLLMGSYHKYKPIRLADNKTLEPLKTRMNR